MAKRNTDWRNYKRQIHHILFFKYPEADVIDNLIVAGKLSNGKRQIDIGIRIKQGEQSVLGIAECKYLKRKITSPVIDSLIGKC